MKRIGSRKVAIVDDTEDTAELFEMIVREVCDEEDVDTFSDGPSFLEQFRTTEYGIILLDLAMPHMDGFEVIHSLRSIDADVPVIAFTANAFPEQRKRALAAGFTDVMTKPIADHRAFCRTIKQFLDPCAA